LRACCALGVHRKSRVLLVMLLFVFQHFGSSGILPIPGLLLRHIDSELCHHYHKDSSNKNPHPSPHIQKILDQQKNQLSKELKEFADASHTRNETTKFKHPLFIDDTFAIYRNHTVLVDAEGKEILST